MNISVVLPNTPDPRLLKRIRFFSKFSKVYVYYWNKQTFDCFPKIEMDNVCYYEFTYRAPFDRPLRRIIPTYKYAQFLKKKFQENHPDLLCVQGLDLLWGAFYAISRRREVKVLYEIADLHYLLIEKRTLVERIVGSFLRLLERRLVAKISNLLLTSERYYDIYYKKIISKDKVIFFPNLPELSAFDRFRKKETGIFTVGYIGSIRFEKQIIMLVDVCRKLNINVIIAGIDSKGVVTEYCREQAHVVNLGKYNYESQIANIYGMCDCIYSVYDTAVSNVKAALPNKLYEAVYCKLPIIVAKQTYLSEVVEKWGVGCAVDSNSYEELEKCLISLMRKGLAYENIIRNCKERENYFDINFYNDKLIPLVNASQKSNNYS